MSPDCVVAILTTILCNHPLLPNEWPSAKIIHVPLGFIEPATPEARDRWLSECRPQPQRDRYGVTRMVYAKPACEFGP